MPQMAPLNWTWLMIYFSLIMMTILLINFYMSTYTIKTKKSYKNHMMLNWKW